MANLSSPSIPTVDNEGSINAADELKNEGNVYFRSSQWDQALAAYRSALGHLPKNTNSQTRDDASEELSKNEQEERIASSTDDQPSSQVEPDPVANLRAILNANIAACYVQLGEHKQAVDACSEALLDNPKYVKVLFRRAKSNEALDSWSSLTAAQEDYNTLLKLLPPDSPQLRETERTMRSLKPRLESAQKRETGEMLDKLKGLGNSILGNFGLSTDNFKFEPNGQGGYSMNFQR